MSNRNSRNQRNGRNNRNLNSSNRNQEKAALNKKQGFNGQQNSLKDQQLARDFFKINEESIKNCPYCSKPVNFLSTAITVNGIDEPIHFDCIINKITQEEALLEDEKVSYLGKGTFGIIKTTKDSPGFFIKKRIQIEPENETAHWRKSLSSRIKKEETP